MAEAEKAEPAKGEFGGECNRTCCNRRPATWWNFSTQRFYCDDCAYILNEDPFNKRDAQELYGHSLLKEASRADEFPRMY